MNIKKTAINFLARWLIVGSAFEQAKNIVFDLERTGLSYEHKKNITIEKLMKLGYNLNESELNLAFGLAYEWIRS